MLQRPYMKLAAASLLCMLAVGSRGALADTVYKQTNLVSDLPGVAAHQDGNVVNAWGIDFGPGGPVWISNNGTATTSVYTGGGTSIFSVGVPGAPTGVAFNGTSGFQTAPGKKALFIFGSEDGSISTWTPPPANSPPSDAVVKVSPSGAVYKGVTIGTVPFGGVGKIPLLYAANFNSGQVDVYGTDFSKIGSFTDNTVPTGYAPFNVQDIGGQLYVTFAQQDADKHDDVAGAGHGFIDIFNLDGSFVKRFASGGPLDSPWGLAKAPAGFGDFSGDLLVGNFGDGTINAFDSAGNFKGQLLGKDGKPLTIEGLWGLKFGDGMSGTKNGPADTLFFTAGIPDHPGGELEAHGLFGTITAVPEPGTYALVAAGLALVVMLRKRISSAV